MLLTPRFSLPLLATAQAQKEVTHNEALTLLDALVHAAVEAGPQADPPIAPVAGQCWLVASAATGDWTGHDHRIALWAAGGWRFAAPRDGMRMVRLADGAWLRFEGGAWVEPTVLASPSGGAVIDSEARATLAALILLLDAHGLMISG